MKRFDWVRKVDCFFKIARIIICVLIVPIAGFAQDEDIRKVVFGKPSNAVETSLLQGTVIDQDSNDPIIGATVLVRSGGSGAVSDDQGTFSLLLPSGKYVVEISFLGYAKQIWEIEIYEHSNWSISIP